MALSGGLLWYCIFMGLLGVSVLLWLVAAFLPALPPRESGRGGSGRG